MAEKQRGPDFMECGAFSLTVMSNVIITRH